MTSNESTKPNALQLATASDKCAEYVKRYRSHWKASAASYIELTVTVKDAEDNLSKAEQRIFHNQVGLDPKGSTYRKFISIADISAWLREHVERIPPTWTTIYELSLCSESERTKLLADGVIKPSLTSEELSKALDRPKKKASAKGGRKSKANKPSDGGDITTSEPATTVVVNEPAAASSSPATVMEPQTKEDDRIGVSNPRVVQTGDLGPIHDEAVLIDLRKISNDDRCSFVGALRALRPTYGFKYTLGATIQRLWDEAGSETEPERPRVPEGFVQRDYLAELANP